jgi:hypothetical protein
MDYCIYCGKEITGQSKTNEHVIPQWIIKYLESEKIPTGVVLVNNRKEIFPPRNSVAMTMTHKICNDCNNGWLSKIDNSCKEILTDFINANHFKKLTSKEYSKEDIENLYILIYKIFLNFMATSPFKIDKIPFYKAFFEKHLTPSDVVLFYSSISTSKPISIGHLDNWSLITDNSVLDWSTGSESGLRFKMFVQLGYSSFVLCCAGNSKGKIVYDDSFLIPIVDNFGSKVMKSNLEPHPAPVDDNIVNRILWSIKLDLTDN